MLTAADRDLFVITKRLIEKGANINHTNHNGDNALMIAVLNNNLEAVKFLIDHGINFSNLNNQEESALDIAIITKKSPEIINLLKQVKATVRDPLLERIASIVNPLFGRPGFDKKLNFKEVELIISTLQKNSVNKSNLSDIDNPEKNRTLLSRIMLHVKDLAALELLSDNLDLLVNKVNLTRQDSKLRTPLMIAIEKSSNEPADQFAEIAARLFIKMQKLKVIDPQQSITDYYQNQKNGEDEKKELPPALSKKTQSILKNINLKINHLRSLKADDFKRKTGETKEEVKDAAMIYSHPATKITPEKQPDLLQSPEDDRHR